MKCFNHSQADAVAICKNCNKGLCPGCAVDLINGVACINHCEAEVKAIIEIAVQNKSAYQKVSGAYARNGVIYGLIGVIFLAFGLIIVKSPLGLLFLPVGTVFLIGSWFNYSTSKKIGSVKR